LAWVPPGHYGSLAGLARLAGDCGLDAAAPVTEGGGRGACQALLLGFGALAEPQIEARVARFAAALRDDQPRSAIGAD